MHIFCYVYWPLRPRIQALDYGDTSTWQPATTFDELWERNLYEPFQIALIDAPSIVETCVLSFQAGQRLCWNIFV